MAKALFIALCTVLFGAIGFYVGQLVHDGTTRTLITTGAGAAGGFGIGCATAQVFHLWQTPRRRA